MKTVAYTGAPVTAATYTNPTVTMNAHNGISSISTTPVAGAFTKTTATDGLTTVLTSSSTPQQYFTGTGISVSPVVQLPDVSTLYDGFSFKIVNNTNFGIVVWTSDTTTFTTLVAPTGGTRGGWGFFTCVNTAGGGGTASWSYEPGALTL